MKRRYVLVLFLTAFAGGCASYTHSKIELTGQARTGVTRLRDALAADAEQRRLAADVLRQQLDVAFDADVRARPVDGLTPEWLIEHRKAYAATIDAFDARQRGEANASTAMLATLDAIGLALDQLQEMHALELKLTLPEVKR